MRILWLFMLLLITAPAFPAPDEAHERSPNVLFIAIDDLRNDLGALGAEYMQTPSLDAFARESRLFSHHFVQVPTCGSSRAALLRGKRSTQPEFLPNTAIANTQQLWGHQSLPSWFRRHGYQTLSLGKITHYPGGLTGDGWAEGPEELPGAWDRAWVPASPWETPEDMMHGYAHGRPRDRGNSPPWQAFDGPDSSYPDAWVAGEAVDMLQKLSQDDEPWFFAVGFFKPHLPFAAPRHYFDLYDPDRIPEPENTGRHPRPSSWHASGEMMGNYGHDGNDPRTGREYARRLRHGYAAATSYVDVQVGRLLDSFEQLGLEENTIVVIWGDHGFALGEQGIWGKHSLYEVALKSPLMIRYPGMDQRGQASNAVVETVDLFPTLTDLTGLPTPEGLHGRSLRKQLESPRAGSDKAAFAHYNRGQSTVRTDDWRLIVHRPEKEIEAMELFDFRQSGQGERRDPAGYPDVVEQLLEQMEGQE
ncbi:MAG: sulfatase [Balneolales bacterium]